MINLTMDEAKKRLPELIDEAIAVGSPAVVIDGRPCRLVADDGDDFTPPALTDQGLLTHLDADLVLARYADAPGRELEGKFLSPESSSALAANAFGPFLARPEDLPRFAGIEGGEWPPISVTLECEARFPWRGGRHPCLDVLIQTSGAVIGIESKRYEPFRSKARADLSEAYWRPVWGDRMKRYERLRDDLASGDLTYRHLDATQLVKHAFGLRTLGDTSQRFATLLYLFAEPARWADGREIAEGDRARHRAEIADFASRVAGDEVMFRSMSYGQLLDAWDRGDDILAEHAWQVRTVFAP